MSYRDIDFQMTVFIGWIDPYPGDSDSQISDLISSEWFYAEIKLRINLKKKRKQEALTDKLSLLQSAALDISTIYLFMCQSQHAFCYI